MKHNLLLRTLFAITCLLPGTISYGLTSNTTPASTTTAGTQSNFPTSTLTKVASSPVKADMVEIIKSPSDKSEYRYLKLDNGIKVVLVSYPDTELASAAITINAGSNQEPDEWPGLAHLLEHTLFLGSEKYPDPNSFDAYIEKHGGEDNAWTGQEETAYYFSIHQNYLFSALDRLSQFFIAPRLDANWIDKERHAVDSEYQIYRQDEYWQYRMVQQATMNQNHPSSRFSIGSLDTLKDHDGLSLQKALRNFHQQWYVSENMAIVLVSSFSLDEMAYQVNQLLGSIPQQAPPERPPKQLFFTANEQGKRIDIETATHTKSLDLVFPLKINPADREKGHGDFITYLLGHEGRGSLHNLLINKGWIQSLFAEYSHNYPNADITLSIGLTDDGYHHIEEIISLVFDNLQLIKKHGVKKDIFLEQKQAYDLAFRFMERSSPEITAIYLTQKIFEEESPRELIRGDYHLGSFAPRKIHNILAQMRPEQLIMMVTSNQPLPAPDEDVQTEPWSGVQYSVRTLTEEQLTYYRTLEKHNGLYIPAPNPFLPKQLMLNREPEHAIPEKQADYPELNVWSHHDHSFGIPKTFIRVRLYDHNPPNLQDQLHSALFFRILQDELNEQYYLAAVAGFHLDFWKDNHGVVLMMDGYTEKMPQLLATVLATITHLQIKPALLQRYKDELHDEFEDDDLSDPTYLLYRAFDQLTAKDIFPYQEQLRALPNITAESLREWADRLLHGDGAITLINGNASAKQRAKLLEILSSYLTAGSETNITLNTPRFAKEQSKQNTCYINYLNDNNSLLITQSSTSRELKDIALYHLLAKLVGTPFYAKLRTDEQLGYRIEAQVSGNGDEYPLLAFIIESPDHKPEYLNERVSAFLQNFQTELSNLSKEELAELQKTLVAEINEPIKDLYTQTEIFWNNLEQGYIGFDGANRLAQAVEEVTLEQIQSLLKQIVDGHRLLKLYGYGYESEPDDRTLMRCEDPAFAEKALAPPLPATYRPKQQATEQ